MGTAEPLCKLCGNTQQWHRETPTQHQFIPMDGDLSGINARKEKPKQPTQVQPQGDPVLRIALLRAGVLTPDDLKKAEDDLKSGQPIIVFVDGSDLPQRNGGD